MIILANKSTYQGAPPDRYEAQRNGGQVNLVVTSPDNPQLLKYLRDSGFGFPPADVLKR